MRYQADLEKPKARGSVQQALPTTKHGALLLGMLEDLTHRIREESISAADAAAVLRDLAPFCRPRPEGEGTGLVELRMLLHSREFRERAPGFADFFARVARGKGH